jgi:type I restriction enzyme S subunit
LEWVASQGSTVGHFNMSDIGSLLIFLPPIAEQVAIIQSVTAGTRDLDEVIYRREREIDLLREYRTSLVANVVTGKLDVREAATRLPEEVTTLDTPQNDTDLIDEIESADEEAVV